MPEQVEEPVALVNYQHNGQFDYLVYVIPSYLYGNPVETLEEAEPSLYFTNIIDKIDVEFNYAFIADRPNTKLSINVDIVAIVTGPSGWQQEVPLSSTDSTGSNFTSGFPLKLDEFDELINEIEEELEIRRPDFTGENIYDLLIEARVAVKGYAGAEQINDTFVQPMEIRVGRGTLEWDAKLTLSQRKSDGGFSYKHQGNFTYTIWLKENSLYESRTLGPGMYSPPSLIALPPGEITFPRLTDIMKTGFSYQFQSDKPVRNLTEEVLVTATLEFSQIWHKTFILVPKSQKSGDFGVDFSVDINFFNELANTIKNEIGMGPPTHVLTIKAEVHTRAETDFGYIDEVFTQTMKGELGPSVIIWSGELKNSKAGSIMGTKLEPNTEKFIGLSAGEATIVLPTVAAITLPFAIYLLIINIIYKPIPPSRLEKEARRTKKKHKGLIVDVEELPDVKDQAVTVISLSSLDDLIATAENLFKPVLHKAEEERHTYCVMDDTTRYEYTSESRPKQMNLTSNESP